MNIKDIADKFDYAMFLVANVKSNKKKYTKKVPKAPKAKIDISLVNIDRRKFERIKRGKKFTEELIYRGHEKCGKIIYQSRKEAVMTANKIEKKHNGEQVKSIYFCPPCNGFHFSRK